jgi:glycosyltransferase involved in cell wall biosynthesis
VRLNTECYHKGRRRKNAVGFQQSGICVYLCASVALKPRPSVAWFSPMPPVRTGIAADNAKLIGALAGDYAIDVFVDDPVARAAPGTRSAHDFIWLHRQRPYDLTVYQLGNSSHHNYQWPYLFRYPGLVVLHDVHLHHARAAALLAEHRAADYRAEFAANHPDVNPDLAELAAAGFDSFLYYLWPMTRLVVETSRLTAVHSRAAAERLRTELPGSAIETVGLSHGVPVGGDDDARRSVRAAYGIAPDALVFGVFGALTPERRLSRILPALAVISAAAPSAHLLLAGAPAPHYDIAAEVRARGVADRVTMTGYLETDEDLTACIAACDVALSLRWPTARETSGPWLRALAAGKPTVIVDLAHLWDVPSLDPRTWAAQGAGDPVTVAIDILDEDHSLRLAMRRLAGDAALRATLGAAARRYWQREHSLEKAAADYRRVMALAGARPVPRPALPPHLLDDAGGTARRILAELGVEVMLKMKNAE